MIFMSPKETIEKRDAEIMAYLKREDGFCCSKCDSSFLRLLHSRDKALIEAVREELRGEIEEKFSFDDAHITGSCSFPLLAICAAEEQKVKMKILAIINNQPLS